jgi:uncharacterized membrane protein YfbV (UPF0208 family)
MAVRMPLVASLILLWQIALACGAPPAGRSG